MESPEVITFSDDFDSACSTPFVSAPSSPGRNPHPTGFFYSAPASPIHYMISSSSSKPKGSVTSPDQPSGPFEFEFTRKQAQTLATGSMTSADELFFNGQIRPMKLSSHLQRPQVLCPLLDIHTENENENENENDDDDDDDVTEEPVRGRDYRSKSLRRRARSMSPLRTCEWLEEFEQDAKQNLEQQEDNNNNNNNSTMNKVKLTEMETTPSGASSRSSSLGRSSKRWVFLKEFLYRSKSEGRTSTSTSSGGSSNNNNNNTNNIKFWTSLSFSPNKEKKLSDNEVKGKGKVAGDGSVGAKKAVNGVSNRRLGRSARSAHEVHYTLNRAQSEEMRRKTYLPYKQGLLGCLGFSSKSYGAMNGFARALNPVSSR